MATTGTTGSASDWIGVGLSAIGGWAGSKATEAETKASIAQNRQEQALEAQLQRQLTVDRAANDYYYNRLGRERKRKGLSEFRQFRSSYAQDSV